MQSISTPIADLGRESIYNQKGRGAGLGLPLSKGESKKMLTGKEAYEQYCKSTASMLILEWDSCPPHVKNAWEELVNGVRFQAQNETEARFVELEKFNAHLQVRVTQEAYTRADLEEQNKILKGNRAYSITGMAKEIHDIAVEKGWYSCSECLGDTKCGLCNKCNGTGLVKRNFAEMIALMHSELSEALEEYRKGKEFNQIYHEDTLNGAPYTSMKPEGIGIELADCIIRILDTAVEEGIDIEKCIKLKVEYNKTRPYKHGGKKC